MSATGAKTPRGAFGKLVRNEARLALRVPAGLFLGLGLPLLLMVVFGSNSNLTHVEADFGGMSYFTSTFPILLAMTTLSLSMMTLPRVLVNYRELGVLRSLSVTPVHPSWLLAAQVIVNLVIAVVGQVVLVVVGVKCFGLNAPKNLPAFLLTDVLTISALFALGLFITAVLRNSGYVNAAGGLLFNGLMFFGGLWMPRETMSGTLLAISDWTPLGSSVAAMQSAIRGASMSGQPLLCLALYTVVFGFLAVRFFRWE